MPKGPFDVATCLDRAPYLWVTRVTALARVLVFLLQLCEDLFNRIKDTENEDVSYTVEVRVLGREEGLVLGEAGQNLGV